MVLILAKKEEREGEGGELEEGEGNFSPLNLNRSFDRRAGGAAA